MQVSGLRANLGEGGRRAVVVDHDFVEDVRRGPPGPAFKFDKHLNSIHSYEIGV